MNWLIILWRTGESKIWREWWQAGDSGKSRHLISWQNSLLLRGDQFLFDSVLQLIGWFYSHYRERFAILRVHQFKCSAGLSAVSVVGPGRMCCFPLLWNLYFLILQRRSSNSSHSLPFLSRKHKKAREACILKWHRTLAGRVCLVLIILLYQILSLHIPMHACVLGHFSHVPLSVTLWTVACL